MLARAGGTQPLRLAEGETRTFEISFGITTVLEHCRFIGDSNPQHHSHEAAVAWTEQFRTTRPPLDGVQVVVPASLVFSIYLPKMIEWFGSGTTFCGVKNFECRRPLFTSQTAKVNIVCRKYGRWGAVHIGFFESEWRVDGAVVCKAEFVLAIP